MRRFESLKKIIVLWLGYLALLLQTVVYAYIWMEHYYPIISKFTQRIKYEKNGHLAIFAIYLVLLFFFTSTYGGLKVGYLKLMDLFISQVFALLFVNSLSYLQLSLMNNWLLDPDYFIRAMAVQVLIAIIFDNISIWLYRRVFPPREMLFVHGDHSVEDCKMHECVCRHGGGGGRDHRRIRGGGALGHSGGGQKPAPQVLLQQIHPGLYDAKDTGCSDQGL